MTELVRNSEEVNGKAEIFTTSSWAGTQFSQRSPDLTSRLLNGWTTWNSGQKVQGHEKAVFLRNVFKEGNWRQKKQSNIPASASHFLVHITAVLWREAL